MNERRNAEDRGDIAAAYPPPAVCQPFLLGEVFGADQNLGFLPYVFPSTMKRRGGTTWPSWI